MVVKENAKICERKSDIPEERADKRDLDVKDAPRVKRKTKICRACARCRNKKSVKNKMVREPAMKGTKQT